MRLILSGGLVLAILLSTPVAAQLVPVPETWSTEPAEGFWYDPERPGTGFSLERRGDTVALAFFHFREDASGASDWHLATGTLDGDTVATQLLHFSGGSCLGCTPFEPADLEESARPVVLQFQSAREATLQIDDGAPRRVVAMPYGVGYVDSLRAPADVPLPDLRGRWLVGSADGTWNGVLTLVELEGDRGALTFRGGASGFDLSSATFSCGAREDVDTDICVLTLDPFPHFAPPPIDIGLFRIEDIGEDRMTGVTPQGVTVVAWRIEDAEGQP